MKKIVPILFAITLVSMASKCKDTAEPPCCAIPPVRGILEMNFKATYTNKPLVINQIYDYNGKKIKFSKLQFFLTSDTNYFTKPIGQADKVPVVNLVDFTKLENSEEANKGILLPISVPNGAHTLINFNIGIDKKTNTKSPRDFKFPDGMADSGNFWPPWASYIFVKLEGAIDNDDNGTLETGITLHTGGDEVLTNLQFKKNYQIEDLKTTTANFELNVTELVKNIDLTTVNSTHQVGSIPIMKIMMGNFATALTVK